MVEHDLNLVLEGVLFDIRPLLEDQVEEVLQQVIFSHDTEKKVVDRISLELGLSKPDHEQVCTILGRTHCKAENLIGLSIESIFKTIRFNTYLLIKRIACLVEDHPDSKDIYIYMFKKNLDERIPGWIDIELKAIKNLGINNIL